jgi:hypothetical protein
MAKNHYVNNAEFLKALIQYKKSIQEAEVAGLLKPIVPDYIGECILQIADHLSYKPNFRMYPFREDMVGDGIENCLTYLDKFDSDNYSNPFAYFTQVVWYAFIRRIFKEKKQLYVKYKCIQSSHEFSEYVNQDHDTKSYENTYLGYLRKNMGDIISEFEDKKQAKKKKKNTNSLERFFAPDVEEKAEVLEIDGDEILLLPAPSAEELEISDV